ncbi:MAG: ABC transporter ATP-binding protein [Eubacteriaceae bacterium]|nr:ABC transporter ATP-binding protein [Eubacteriaceae bacterium]
MIEANGIYKSFYVASQPLQVLNNVSLLIKQGEFVSLMGPSGSGKSTLLYILGGLDSADSGSVSIDGRQLSGLSDAAASAMRRDSIGFVFQAYNLIDNLSVEENILLPALLGGKKRESMLPWLEELLQGIGMHSHRKHRPAELSGGQQQRTALARALINRPKVIFADEPTGNLDSRNGAEVLELLGKMNRQYGVTILMVTHSEDAALSSGRVIRLRDGQIISAPDELMI